MNANSLIPVESINAVEVFTGKHLDELLEQIRKETATIVPDISSASGRKEVASLAYKVARSKTTIDDAGKSLVAEWKAKSSEVDAARKKARDYLDALKDEVRAPLDAWEAEQALIEREKVEAEERAKAEAEAARIAELERREAEIKAKEDAIRQAEEAAQRKAAAELAERERIEREERIRKEAAEKAEKDAAEAVKRAEREKADAEARSIREAEAAKEAARVAAEKAEADKAKAVRDAEERAKQEAAKIESDRQQEQARIQAEEAKRAANKKHCAAINNAVVADLEKAGCDAATAKLVVIAIASGKIAHTTISY